MDNIIPVISVSVAVVALAISVFNTRRSVEKEQTLDIEQKLKNVQEELRNCETTKRVLQDENVSLWKKIIKLNDKDK